jgi:hypothetical protein
MLTVNVSQSFRFLRLIDPKEKVFAFQTFKEKGDSVSNVSPKVINTSDLTELRSQHQLGAGIYITVNETNGRSRQSKDIIRIRAVWQEDDDGYSGSFPLEPSIVVESSPGHFHRYWLIADNWPTDEKGRADFAVIMERMVESYGCDNSAKDISRVLRLPGFFHRKADKGPVAPHMVRIVEASGKRYTRAEILAAFPPIVRENKTAHNTEWKPRGDEDERIRDALNSINPDPRDLWLQMGMAIKAHMGEAGRPLWDAWSRRSNKYDEKDQEKTWRSFQKDGITIATLFHHAKQAGWKDPRLHESTDQEDSNKSSSSSSAASENSSSERVAVLVRADSLKPESINWAWPNRFAFGKMAMIAGDPGLGKSTILIEIAALHSNGGEFPCGEGKAILCETLYLTAEDGLRDTLIPRLMAAEADLTKIHFLTGTKVEGASTDDAAAMFDITKDVDTLRRVFQDNPDIKILIIDPLTAYLGVGTKAKENTDVRRVLTPLVKLVEEFGVLLLANNHLNKNSGKALYRILDSIAFVALGRTVHLVAKDADNKDNRKFICDKSNIGSKPLGLTYIIQKCLIPGEQGEEIETSRICWGTVHIDESADEALATETGSATAKDEAVEFLKLVLGHGRVCIQDIETQARSAGLLGKDQEISTSKPFRSARAELRIISTRDGFGPGAIFYWSLPPPTTIPDPPTILAPIVASSNTRASMSPEGKYGENGGGQNERDSHHDDGTSLHTCPRPPYLPSLDEGKYVGKYGAEGNHGLSDIEAVHEELTAQGEPTGEMVANGFAISHSPEDRKPLEPGELGCRIWIRQIHRPAISAGPNDNLDDFTNERRLN